VSETKIAAQKRTEFGKGAARRLRRDSQVPAVIYGHGSDPLHISLPGHELMLALRQSNVLLTIDVEGEPQLALPKQIQRDPVKGFLEHVDLLLVRSGEKVSVDVAIHTVGDAAPDTLLVIEANTIPVTAEATHIPESFIVSIEGLRAGAQIHASDVILPDGVELDIEPDTLVINVTAATTAEALEAELLEAEAEIGAEHDAPQTEGDDDAEQDPADES
jgi:large subunit ribosomal protein L25